MFLADFSDVAEGPDCLSALSAKPAGNNGYILMGGMFNYAQSCTLSKTKCMKKLIAFLIFSLVISSGVRAEGLKDTTLADPKDVSSVNAIITALYDVISGPSRQKRNWDRMRSLFLPEARMIATGRRPDGTMTKRTMSVEDYITVSGPYLEKDGFFEREISRKTEEFGSIVHVFSTYDSKRQLSDEKPFMRGINSIQLWNDGKRWWIVTILWHSESEATPIPQKYLQ